MAYTKTLNTGLPECRNTKTRNTTLLKPGKHGKKLIKFKQENSPSMPTPGGGYPQKNWVGVCGSLPKTLTLFMTKICDFPYPIYDLTKTLIPYLYL